MSKKIPWRGGGSHHTILILVERDPGNRHARRVELDLRHRRNARRGVERHLRNHRTWLPNPVHTCDT